MSEKLDFNTPALLRYRKMRYLKDRLATVGVGIGGWSILTAILLIFAYLLYEVMPMFTPASVDVAAVYQSPAKTTVKYLAMEEQNEVALRIGHEGDVLFFNAESGEKVTRIDLDLPVGVEVTAIATMSEASRLMAIGLSNGEVMIAKHNYLISYPNDVRLITPRLDFPYGEESIEVADESIERLAINEGEESLLIAATTGSRLSMKAFAKTEDFLSGELTLEEVDVDIPNLNLSAKDMAFDADQHWLFILGSRYLSIIDVSEAIEGSVELHAREEVPQASSMQMLLGGISVLLGFEDGHIEQRFMVRDQTGYSMQKIRSFDGDGVAVQGVASEQRRKGFLAIDQQGSLSIFHSTAHRHLLSESFTAAPVKSWALGPRATAMLLEGVEGSITRLTISNKHPEVSWSALWDEVWYENYKKPEYIWQSSASNNDFEPKYSLTPLAFGTLKAAFYAMLIGAPLAICGAIYTAYFMAPALRRKVKPLIELMEALPTVILGFLAGLWLAPFMEDNLASIFMILIFMPIGVLVASFLFAKMPAKYRFLVPDGWQPALLAPVIIIVGLLCVESGDYVELLFFGGDMRAWLTHEAGIPFDQRNALVVGIAMGFAVIPTIFSIAEDAIFSVPKSLSYGSLALGATPWQTLIGVVLPTASPGMFSALMIGMGRAVGETMIVLMATGNTPIMDANIFEGMRTLAANIAVEVPEAEVDSSHYRVLFLAAFVLFGFTFIVNTTAEMIRQRLRKKYGSL